LQSYESEVSRLTQDLEQLRESQLTEIDQRCREVDALKQQLSGQLSTLQQDHDNLSRQLVGQRAEREYLLSTQESLEGELVKRQHEYEGRVQAISDHADGVEKENSTLQARLSQQQRFVMFSWCRVEEGHVACCRAVLLYLSMQEASSMERA
jgi:chromosome segregation ATPase